MSDKMDKALENLDKAISKLEEYLAAPINEDRDRAGIIQAFEFTFELYWKTFQKKANEEGISANSPKTAFEAAFQMGLIDSKAEAIWLTMIVDRNLTVHTYQEELSKEILGRIQQNYLAQFKKARTKF